MSPHLGFEQTASSSDYNTMIPLGHDLIRVSAAFPGPGHSSTPGNHSEIQGAFPGSHANQYVPAQSRRFSSSAMLE